MGDREHNGLTDPPKGKVDMAADKSPVIADVREIYFSGKYAH
jgi:hypothetical protein